MLSHYTKHVFICTNQKAPGKQCCANSGGEEYFDFMKSKLLEFDLHGLEKSGSANQDVLDDAALVLASLFIQKEFGILILPLKILNKLSRTT